MDVSDPEKWPLLSGSRLMHESSVKTREGQQNMNQKQKAFLENGLQYEKHTRSLPSGFGSLCDGHLPIKSTLMWFAIIRSLVGILLQIYCFWQISMHSEGTWDLPWRYFIWCSCWVIEACRLCFMLVPGALDGSHFIARMTDLEMLHFWHELSYCKLSATFAALCVAGLAVLPDASTYSGSASYRHTWFVYTAGLFLTDVYVELQVAQELRKRSVLGDDSSEVVGEVREHRFSWTKCFLIGTPALRYGFGLALFIYIVRSFNHANVAYQPWWLLLGYCMLVPESGLLGMLLLNRSFGWRLTEVQTLSLWGRQGLVKFCSAFFAVGHASYCVLHDKDGTAAGVLWAPWCYYWLAYTWLGFMLDVVLIMFVSEMKQALWEKEYPFGCWLYYRGLSCQCDFCGDSNQHCSVRWVTNLPFTDREVPPGVVVL
ncbi:hypothetical protein LTR17_004703 [Elasticomyces elasticus]|nr:hypothetical protein LTR17_004703 [Elasticomyces elasticus]